MLVFLAAMSGFALTGDLFNLFVVFELMSIAAFALCGLKIAEPAPLQGAFNFAITNSVAGFIVLTGIALLYSVTGALNMAQIGLSLQSRHDPLVLFAWSLLSCGFLVKAATVPFTCGCRMPMPSHRPLYVCSFRPSWSFRDGCTCSAMQPQRWQTSLHICTRPTQARMFHSRSRHGARQSPAPLCAACLQSPLL